MKNILISKGYIHNPVGIFSLFRLGITLGILMGSAINFSGCAIEDEASVKEDGTRGR